MRGILKLTDDQGDPTWFHHQWASKNYQIQHVADLIHWLDEKPAERTMDTAGYLAYAEEQGEGFLPTEDVSDVPDCRDASNPIDLHHRYDLTLSEKDRSFRFAVVDVDRWRNMTVAHDLADRVALYDAAARMAQDLAKSTRAYAAHNGGYTPPSMPSAESWDAEAEKFLGWKTAAEGQPQVAEPVDEQPADDSPIKVGDLVIAWNFEGTFKWDGPSDNPRFPQIEFSYGAKVHTLRCVLERVAPHDITIPARDERVVVQKLPKALAGTAGPWMLTVFGSRECFKTKTAATATGLRRVAIRDWHETRALETAPEPAAAEPETAGGEPAAAEPETAGGEPAAGEYAAVWSVPLTPGVGRLIGGQTRAAFRTEPVTVLGPVNMEPSMVRVRTTDGQVRRAMREHITATAPAAEPEVALEPVAVPAAARPGGQIMVMHVSGSGVRKVDVPGLTTPAAAAEPAAAPAATVEPAADAEEPAPEVAEQSGPNARTIEILRAATWSLDVVKVRGQAKGMDVLKLNSGYLNYEQEFKPVKEVTEGLGGAWNKTVRGFIFEPSEARFGGGYTTPGRDKLAAWLERHAPASTETTPATTEAPVTETDNRNEEKPMTNIEQGNNVDPRIAGWADEIMEMIEEDITNGIMPNGVRSFGELHSYLDANDYTEVTQVPWGAGVASESDRDGMGLVNGVQNQVTRQLVERIKVKGRQTDAADRPVTYTEDGRGYIVDGTGSWYVTQCCGSPVTYSTAMGDGVLCCKGCYGEVDEALAEVPPAVANA